MFSCKPSAFSEYFTDLTFKNCLNSGGFLLHHFEKYNYSFESVLIGIVKPDDNKNTFKNFKVAYCFFGQRVNCLFAFDPLI